MEERHDDPKLTGSALTLARQALAATHPAIDRAIFKATKADRRRLDIINGRKRGRL